MMNYKQFKLARIITVIAMSMAISFASQRDNFYLAMGVILIGMGVLYFLRTKLKEVFIDERIISVVGKASRMTYTVNILLLAFLSLFLIFNGRSHGRIYSESLGIVFSYIVMFNLAIYILSFYFFNKKHGGNKK